MMSVKEVEEHVVCNQCGHDDWHEIHPDTRQGEETDWAAYCCTNPGYGVHPRIVKCNNCGLMYANPRPRQGVIASSYEAVEDPLYLEERSAREATFAHHLRAFEQYTGPGEARRLLDVGAYIGVFVEQAQHAGWDAWGLEPSVWAVNYAQSDGLNVVQGLIEDHPFEPESFDAVTMWDVIEHVTDPKGTLQAAYDLLRPGGWVAVHTMDANSLFAKIMGKRWPWLMDMHIYYFTRQTLSNMLESVGFEVERVRPQGRYLRLKYLTTRLRPYSQLMANIVDGAAGAVGLAGLHVPLNFGDLVTAFAQKPNDPT